MNQRILAGCLAMLFASSASDYVSAQVESRPDRQQKPTPQERRYDAGPLKISEFVGRPNHAVRSEAKTMARVMFQYKWQSRWERDQRSSSRKEFEAKITSLSAYSVFMSQDSWWKTSQDPELLDHEQGHFDLVEIAARRAQLSFNRTLAKKRTLAAKGATEAEAAKLLLQQLEKVMKIVNDQAVKDNVEYDEKTNHGFNQKIQKEHRRVQTLTLKRLGAEMKKAERGKK